MEIQTFKIQTNHCKDDDADDDDTDDSRYRRLEIQRFKIQTNHCTDGADDNDADADGAFARYKRLETHMVQYTGSSRYQTTQDTDDWRNRQTFKTAGSGYRRFKIHTVGYTNVQDTDEKL